MNFSKYIMSVVVFLMKIAVLCIDKMFVVIKLSLKQFQTITYNKTDIIIIIIAKMAVFNMASTWPS